MTQVLSEDLREFTGSYAVSCMPGYFAANPAIDGITISCRAVDGLFRTSNGAVITNAATQLPVCTSTCAAAAVAMSSGAGDTNPCDNNGDVAASCVPASAPTSATAYTCTCSAGYNPVRVTVGGRAYSTCKRKRLFQAGVRGRVQVCDLSSLLLFVCVAFAGSALIAAADVYVTVQADTGATLIGVEPTLQATDSLTFSVNAVTEYVRL
jgi:hypothetical protein